MRSSSLPRGLLTLAPPSTGQNDSDEASKFHNTLVQEKTFTFLDEKALSRMLNWE